MSDKSWVRRFLHASGRVAEAATGAAQESHCRSGTSEAADAAASDVNCDPHDSGENRIEEVETWPLSSSRSSHRVREYINYRPNVEDAGGDFQSVVQCLDSGYKPPKEVREEDERGSTPFAASRRLPCAPCGDPPDRSAPAWTGHYSFDNGDSSCSSFLSSASSSSSIEDQDENLEDVPKRPTRPPRLAALLTVGIQNPSCDPSSDDEQPQPRRAPLVVPTDRAADDDDNNSGGIRPSSDCQRLRRIEVASLGREEQFFLRNGDDNNSTAVWRQVGSCYVRDGEYVARDLLPFADDVAAFARRDPFETRVDFGETRSTDRVNSGTADFEERRLRRRGRRDPEARLEERDLSLDAEEAGFSVAAFEESECYPDDGSATERKDLVTRGAEWEEGELYRDFRRDVAVYDFDDDDGGTEQVSIVVEVQDSELCIDDERNPEQRDSNSIETGLEEEESERGCAVWVRCFDDDIVVPVEDGQCRPSHRGAEAASIHVKPVPAPLQGRPAPSAFQERQAPAPLQGRPALAAFQERQAPAPLQGRPRGEERGEEPPRNELIEEDDVVDFVLEDRQVEGEEVVVVIGPAVAEPSGRGEQRWLGRSAQTMEKAEGSTSQTTQSVESSAAAAAQQAETRTLKDENNFIQNVSQFFNQEDISDVVLKVGNQKFFGHKFVLAKSSEVFRTMLYDKRWQQSHLPEIDLEESEECQRHFEPFLRFLYTAEVQICTHSAVGILCLADKYSVMSLKTLCTRYMVENTLSPKVRNALNWYSWAKALHMEELIDSCTKTISWNMEQLFALPEWLQMDIEFVADIVSNPQLVVSNEFLLYEAVERWLLHDQHVAELLDNSKKLLPLVRFPQMMVQQLYKVETGELASKEGSKELIEKLLNKAYRFRSLCPFQADLDITFSDEFYRPRNYKDLTVDTVRMQNTLRFGIQVDVRTYVGPVPSSVREGEWKITYRKTNDTWTLQVFCHDSAMVNGEARIQAVLVISDDDDRVLQVEASDETVCRRGGSHLTMVITLPSTNEAKLMTVLIKPLPN